jgi:hypothetical protein
MSGNFLNVREFLQQLSNSVFPKRTPPLEVNRLQIEPPVTSVNLFTCNSIHVLNNGPMYKHFLFVLRLNARNMNSETENSPLDAVEG